MPGGEGLTRVERIRRRPDFERAYETGTKLRSKLLTVFLVPNDRQHARFGVAASRKVGKAVQRNRAKRITRELFRRHKVADGVDIVLVPRRELLDAPFVRVEAEYLAALGRLVAHGPAAGPRRRAGHPRPDQGL